MNTTDEAFAAMVLLASQYLAMYQNALDGVTFEHGPVLAGPLPGDLKSWSLE